MAKPATSMNHAYCGLAIRYHDLPKSVENIALLVVLGGPQDPATSTEEYPHFDAFAERALIIKAVEARKAAVGICLGSQLIGEALGATFSHSPEKEIGKFPISLTEAGKNNPKFSHFGDTPEVGHWHNDMPGPTRDSRLETRKSLPLVNGCPLQIVEYSNIAYGFQCHMELTSDVVELLIAASESDLAKLTDRRFVQLPDALRVRQLGRHKLEAVCLPRQAHRRVQEHCPLTRVMGLAYHAVASPSPCWQIESCTDQLYCLIGA